MIIRVICQNMVTVESKKCKVFGLWIFVSAVILHMFRATAHTLPEPNRDPLWIWYFYCFFWLPKLSRLRGCIFCRIHVASRLPLHHRSGEPPNRALSFYERNHLRIELWKAFFMIWEGWLKKQQKILRCKWGGVPSYWFGGWDVKQNPFFGHMKLTSISDLVWNL